MTSSIRQRLPSVADVLYSSVGFVLLMGIITAETKSPFIKPAAVRPPETALDSCLTGSGRQRERRCEGRGERP